MQYQIINGALVDSNKALIPTNDLGMLRGYGAFDFFKVLKGQPIFIEDHMQRLIRSVKFMDLDFSYSAREVQIMCETLIQKNEMDQAGVRIVVTGGFAEDGYSPVEANLYIMMHELPLPSHEEYEKGGVLIAVPYQRDIPQAKTTIYVQAIIHRKKMKETGATDILYHWDGIVRETSRANIFFVDQKRRIHTPDKDVLSGVTRKQVLGLIKGNYELICRDIHMDELPDMEEAFITSSTKSVFPIVLIENTRIGNGIPGPIAKDIESMYQNAIRTYIDNKVPV